MSATLKDWRGNRYQQGEGVGPVICSEPTCDLPAVRHPCNAEGDPNRTHWHGEIHVMGSEGSVSRPFCQRHGDEVLERNAQIWSRR
jgi:hypothetical protein